jgi:hypothetical protein
LIRGTSWKSWAWRRNRLVFIIVDKPRIELGPSAHRARDILNGITIKFDFGII